MEAKQVLANYRYMDIDDLQILFPMSKEDSDGWLSVFEMMEKEKINVFSESTDSISYAGQDSNSVLNGLNQSSEKLILCIDDINGDSVQDHILLPNDQLIKTHGWVSISGVEDKECYYKIADKSYSLKWVERPDVNQYLQSSDYYGFDGCFVLNGTRPETTSLSFIVIDRKEGKYIEQPISEKVLISIEYSDVPEGIDSVTD